jgi:hypothetical protein
MTGLFKQPGGGSAGLPAARPKSSQFKSPFLESPSPVANQGNTSIFMDMLRGSVRNAAGIKPGAQAAIQPAPVVEHQPVQRKPNAFFDSAQAGLARPRGGAGLNDAAAAEAWKARYGKYPRWYNGGQK